MAAVPTVLPWIRGPSIDIPYSACDAHGLVWFGGAGGLVILVAVAAGAALLVVAALEWGYITDRELDGEYVVPRVDPGICLNPAEGVDVHGIAAAAAAILGTWGSVAAVRKCLSKIAPAARR